MSGVTNYFDSDDAALKAFLAGNDILLMPDDVEEVISLIKKTVEKNKILQEQLDFSCKKILALKYWNNLNSYKPISTINLLEDLNSKSSKEINRKIIKNALTVVKNEGILPLNNYNKSNVFFCLSIVVFKGIREGPGDI